MSEKIDKNVEEEVVIDSNEPQVDDIELEEAEEQGDAKIKALRDKLKACEAEKTEHLDALQRAKADFLNSKKRNEEQLKREIARSGDAFIEKLLPLCDSFDMAMADKESWEVCDEKWRNGIEAILSQLSSILKSYNVEKVGAEGDAFDPNIHEAVSVEDGNGADPDTVMKVLQSGYKRDDELIRPAKVILSN